MRTMPIDYNHERNRHTLSGPRVVLPAILSRAPARSLLDVGCGIGTWTKVALDLGLEEVLGVDGAAIPAKQILVPESCFRTQDLTQTWSLGRRFDLVLCLEVAEHLDPACAERLVWSLTSHGDALAFSAACPGQSGQHHVNCRWPSYWQGLFNQAGFYCDDSVRWALWNERSAEPWYRQNLFLAFRNAEKAGREPRLRPVIHPEFVFGSGYERITAGRFSSMEFIETGGMPVSWYLQAPLVGLGLKVANRLRRLSQRKNLEKARALPAP